MSKVVKMVVVIVITVVAFFMALFMVQSVKADENGVYLDENVYTWRDIDGDGYIDRITYDIVKYDPVTVEVELNDRIIYKGSSNYGFDAAVKLVDIKKSDKKWDIVIEYLDGEYPASTVIGNVSWKKNDYQFNVIGKSSDYVTVGLDQPGNGTIMGYYQYSGKDLGWIVVQRPIYISSGKKLKYSSKTELNVASNFEFKTLKSMSLTKKPGDKKAIAMIKSGTYFKVSKIKIKTKAGSDGENITHIYINTSDGQSGWIKLPTGKNYHTYGYSSSFSFRWNSYEWSTYMPNWG